LYDSQSDDNRYAYMFSSLVESWTGYVGATPQTPSWGYWMTEGYGGTESKAVYGQADYSFTDKFTATAGLRYTEDDRLSVGSNLLDTPDWDNWPDVFPNQENRPVRFRKLVRSHILTGVSAAATSSMMTSCFTAQWRPPTLR
jgi:outer membrane receptor protein involved in Fe transport